MTVRVAVIGAGQFGVEHLLAYSTMDDVELVGVRDTDPVRARDVAKRFGTVALPPVPVVADAVSVVVPVHSRGTLITDLLGTDAAVLIEKPLAASTAEAHALERAVRDRVAMVGHVLRFAAPYRRLLDATAELGELRSGHLSRRRSADHADLHPADDVIDLTMIHDLDAATWLAGRRAASVSATGMRGADGRWVRCRAELQHADGAAWVVEGEWAGASGEQEDRASVQGDGGAASISVVAVEADRVYGDALAAELRHFVDHAAAGTPSADLVVSDAAFAVRLAEAVRSSLEQDGARVDLAANRGDG